MRLLLIEDEAKPAQQIKAQLARRAFAVDVAPDGASGLARARSDEYAYLVLDLGLPGKPRLPPRRDLSIDRVVRLSDHEQGDKARAGGQPAPREARVAPDPRSISRCRSARWRQRPCR